MRSRRLFSVIGAAAASLALLAGCVGAPTESTSPATQSQAAYQKVDLTNCAVPVTFAAAPTKAVTLNQGATEVMLALELQDKLVGTAYLDDAVPSKWKAAYDSVPVLAKEYPSKEQFLSAKPDFSYASYSSAFTDKEGVGTREELAKASITTYLSPFGCPKGAGRAAATMENAWKELTEVATIFGVPDRAEKLISEQKAALAKLKKTDNGKGRTALWYDSKDKSPYVGGGTGGPQTILDNVNLKNIFADIDGPWGEGNWEKVVQADPDIIVLAEASWSTADTKIAYLEADPVLKNLKAVKNKAYVKVAFSESTAGVRLVDGAATVSKQLAAVK